MKKRVSFKLVWKYVENHTNSLLILVRFFSVKSIQIKLQEKLNIWKTAETEGKIQETIRYSVPKSN